MLLFNVSRINLEVPEWPITIRIAARTENTERNTITNEMNLNCQTEMYYDYFDIWNTDSHCLLRIRHEIRSNRVQLAVRKCESPEPQA